MFRSWVVDSGGVIKGEGRSDSEELEAAAALLAGDEADDKALLWDKDDDEGAATEVVALKLLKRSDSEQMGKLYKLLRQSPQVIEYYLLTMVYPNFLRYQVRSCRGRAWGCSNSGIAL